MYEAHLGTAQADRMQEQVSLAESCTFYTSSHVRLKTDDQTVDAELICWMLPGATNLPKFCLPAQRLHQGQMWLHRAARSWGL